MKFSIIALLMVVIFVALMVWVKFYAPQEKKRSLLEAKVYETLLKFKEGQIELNEDFLVSAREYFKNPNLSLDELKKMI